MFIYIVAASVTFLLCGFWHGAAWTFIAWGIFHGFFIIIDRIFLIKFLKKTGRIPAMLFTFLVLVTGWVIFRSENLPAAMTYLGKMFTFTGAENEVWLNSKFWAIFILSVFFSFSGAIKKIGTWLDSLYQRPGNGAIIIVSVFSVLLLIVSLAGITSAGFSPFIYLNF